MSGRSAVVDTNIFITARNASESGYSSCRGLIDRIDRGELEAIVSAITIAELRAGIPRHQVSTTWRAMMAHFLTSPNFRVVPLDSDVAEAAGEIRASTRLTLPDAAIVATAHLHKATLVVTQDQNLIRRELGVPVVTPDQVL
jgi:predicted nucleic acid-binding protein